MEREDVRDNKLAGSGSQRDIMRCFACDGRGHKAIACPNRASTYRNELNSHFHLSYCYKCGSSGHDTKDCRNSSPRTQPTQRSGGRSTGGTSTQNRPVACAMQVSRRTEEEEAERGMVTLEFKTGERIKVLNGACIEAEIKDNLPVMSGKVGNKNVEVLQDSRCDGVIVERELVDEADFIGKVGYMMTVNRTLIRAPIARIEVDTPIYTETVEAMCMKDPLFDLIIGNVPGVRKPNDPSPEWGVVAAAATRGQARERGNPKPSKVKEVTSKKAVDKEAKGTETRKGYRIAYEKRRGIWYRIRQRKDEAEDTRKQILVAMSLRAKVMEVAHNSLFGGDLKVKKTEDRIQSRSPAHEVLVRLEISGVFGSFGWWRLDYN